MRHLVCAAFVLAVIGLVSPSAASAQSVFIGGGATIPTGNFADFDGDGPSSEGAKTGWQASAGATFAVGASGLSLGARGFYGRNSHDTEGDRTDLYGGTALGLFSFGGTTLAPFIFGEVGFLTHAFKSDTSENVSDSGLALGGGAGVNIPVGSINLFLVGGYMQGTGDVKDTKAFGISGGVTIPFGGAM